MSDTSERNLATLKVTESSMSLYVGIYPKKDFICLDLNVHVCP